jgi:hypothetical protein
MCVCVLIHKTAGAGILKMLAGRDVSPPHTKAVATAFLGLLFQVQGQMGNQEALQTAITLYQQAQVGHQSGVACVCVCVCVCVHSTHVCCMSIYVYTCACWMPTQQLNASVVPKPEAHIPFMFGSFLVQMQQIEQVGVCVVWCV